ncbi:Sacsin-like [Oopsacas minuta]|uniref:Sacsin-like n=1 Tax=Oopsacas minuta TaxID=111878 RepID=A0AAV7KJE8_9METZ|nr:Sacsin-like [Oopsacas minuta]
MASISQSDFNFGPKQRTLLEEITHILRDYPDGSNILKELLQNADDAEASSIAFLLDPTQHSQVDLFIPGLFKYQGPALYSWNDATFMENDWEGIQRIGKSIKEKNLLKVGRFGLGFVSVYHLTDCPTILSNKQFGINHPLMELTTQGRTGVSCPLLSLTTNPQLSGHLSCFKGYFGFEGQSEYPGTIFRFPFRNEQSEISKNCYDVIRVRNKLLNPLISEAEHALLFLKNITCIEVCERVGGVNKALFKAEVPSAYLDDVKSYRREILEFASSEEFKSSTKIFVCLFPTVSRESGGEEKQTVWLVLNILGFGATKKKLQQFYRYHHLDYLPWVGVALATGVSNLTNCGRWQFKWNKENPSTVFDVISEVFKFPFIVDQDIELNISTGKIFCFLPTQLHSKFPFHFHGYFSLSSNRRAIPWPSDDNESEIGARWNLLLSEDLGSIAYAVFLFITIKALKHSSPLAYHYQLLSRWSPHEPDNSPFSSVLCGGLEILSKHNILLYTQQLGGRWLSICDGFFLPNLTKQYLTNEKVCLELLEKLNEPIIDVPESIQEVILNIPGIKSQISDRTINQNAIRELLRRFSDSNELREFLSSRDKAIPLLEGILTMCSGIESSKRIEMILEGIPLLPIASIDEPQIFAHKPIYISSNTSTLMNIFPGLESLFVDPYIPPKIHSNLLSIAIKCTPLNLIDVTKLVNDPQLFAELLFQSISGKFRFESNDSVDWMPSDPAHPPSTWIVKLFQFIDNSKSLLEAVSHLPILPQNSINEDIVSLLPLRSRTTYIEHSEDSHLIQLEKLLETSGCYLCYRQHFIVRFSEFILPPIPKGLLIALKSKAVLNSFILALDSTVDDNLKFDLIELLIPITNAQNSKIISQLPLFPNTIGNWLKISSIIILPPLKIPLDIAYPPHFISPLNLSVKQLYKKLNSKSLSNDAFIKDHLMPFIQTHKDPRIRNQLIVFVMDNLKLFDLDYLKSEEWILDSSTNTEIGGRVKLYAPSQLFDPRDHILNRLLPPQTSGLFPHNILEDYFDVMRKSLGLKCYKNLSLKLCLQVCRYSLETIVSELGNDWIDTFGALIEFLSLYRSTFGYESWKTLFNIFQSNFVISGSIPVDWPKNVEFSTSTQLCSPQQILICNSQEVYLVGSVQNTLILSQMMNDDVSEGIIREMGFQTEITTQMVVEHLAMLTKSRISKNDSELIHQIVSKIYFFLGRRVAEIQIQSIPLNMIYIPDEVAFVSVNRIVIEVPFDMKPFIYSLQDLQYRAVKFFDFLAIQKSPSSSQLSSILTEINSTYTTLTSTQLELVINILNLIVNLNSHAEVYIPGKDMKMYNPKEEKLVFCDQIWLDRSIIEQDFIFVHEKISNDTAHRLGVSHFNERITDPSEMWFEETEQKIAVTDRIRGILEGYHGTINVLKEMLQNADDAKATEMNVVFDWRIHPSMSLLSPQMEVWQGPAILFYNNSTFLDADFDNLMKIEGATKAHDVTSIGQFGLGFCTVYHLTDLPSFVSRNYIHILDPHGDYLKKGVKIDFCQERLVKYIQIYQDQFVPYQNIFGCDILKPSPFNGTLFRLPIRLSNITSKISLTTFNEQDINQIQANFIKEAESVLFFMQHINSLGIYVINSDSRSEDMKSIHCVKRSANIPLNQPFLQANREHMIHMINGCNSTPVSSSCEYQLSVTDKSDANWIVTYATGSEQCANLLNKLSHTRSLLPFAGVALNLDLFDQDRTAGSNSNLYCFLPLPIQIALPFHCHAMFELRQDRQGLVDTAEAKQNGTKLLYLMH